MVDPSIPQTGSTLLEDTRERAYRWGGQLSQLFGWLLVINFGLVSVGLGVVTTTWPETPEFLASAAGAWLLLLAGCRGFAVLTETDLTETDRPNRIAKPIAVIEAAFCVGTGFVLLHADWPSRPAAVPTALTFSAAVVAACAVLDAAVARFGPREDARRHLIRAGGWLVGALVLMALLSTAPAAALASAAVLVGTAEIIQGGWLVSRASQDRLDPDDDQFIELWKD
jgi:hypothetical protein